MITRTVLPWVIEDRFCQAARRRDELELFSPSSARHGRNVSKRSGARSSVKWASAVAGGAAAGRDIGRQGPANERDHIMGSSPPPR